MAEPDFEVQDEERVVRLASILRHLRRLKILIALHEGKSASASSLSRAGLGENVVDVDYHLRKLAGLGVADVVEVRHGPRGAPQRFYELTDYGRQVLRAAAFMGREPDE